MFPEGTLRIPPFFTTSTVPVSTTDSPLESVASFASLYFSPSWLSKESAPAPCALALAQGRSPRQAATAISTIHFDRKFIANSYFSMGPGRRRILISQNYLLAAKRENGRDKETSPARQSLSFCAAS